MNKDSKILVLGSTGLVGSAVVRELKRGGYTRVLTPEHKPTLFGGNTLDLTHQVATLTYFDHIKPEYVFLCAAKVGGIKSNSDYPAQFITQNILIATNVISSSYKTGVKKLINLGSSCIFPKECKQPMTEDDLLTGKLEQTNEAYAIAKIAAIKMCKAYNQEFGTNYISAMPCNLYGFPNDNFDLENSHVLPALIRKFYEAKDTITLWGDGTPRREFLFVDDLAEALVFLMENYDYKDIGEFINIGYGFDFPIRFLAETIANKFEYKGEIIWDKSKPNGTMKKLLNIDKITNLGWQPRVHFLHGITETCKWFKNNYPNIKGVK